MAGNLASGETVPTGRRVAAWAVDFALITTFAVLLGVVTHYRITDYLSGWAELTGTGVWDVLQSNGDWGGAGKTFGLDVVHGVLVLIIEAFGALIVATFAYQFVGLAWKGRTFGKMLLDLRVRSVRGERDHLGRWQAARRAFAGTMTDVGIYSFACIALLAGSFFLSFLLWLTALVLLAANAFALLGASHRSLVDRFAGTAVVGTELYRKTWDAAKEQMQLPVIMDTVQLQQIRDSERIVQAREIGRNVGHRTARAAREAIASDSGQQAQRVVASAGKRAGAGLKSVYQKRRGSR
ncbi:hypothetical protein GFY24_11655 [Nocardia sp. SYP-A9097]|uniref:RDD family protein n=1 Tax=Nocardia sp. SYP-A9097 TaxID=2663237 RepID=UPI00129A697D|nr:RDD family protein [Nocardia sp. SYP-A9097]MRH88090.1 hypothetical protein [Nocardia sp. SYP-A9097]